MNIDSYQDEARRTAPRELDAYPHAVRLAYAALVNLADAHGFKLSEVAQVNVDKLRARYPAGFTVAAAEAKADEVEVRIKSTLQVAGRDPLTIYGQVIRAEESKDEFVREQEARMEALRWHARIGPTE